VKYVSGNHGGGDVRKAVMRARRNLALLAVLVCLVVLLAACGGDGGSGRY